MEQVRRNLTWFVVALVGAILFWQLVKGIVNIYRLVNIKQEKEKETVLLYAKLAEKKNQLDKVTAASFREVFAKDRLGYFEKGETLFIIEGEVPRYVKLSAEGEGKKVPSIRLWQELFTNGVFKVAVGYP